MAMGHVVLRWFFVERTTYFDDYVRRYTGLPFLVRSERPSVGIAPPSSSPPRTWEARVRTPRSGRSSSARPLGGTVIPNRFLGFHYDEEGGTR